MAATASYVIVGAGVFGASTALHLIRKYPRSSITLIDRNAYDAPTRVAASWDWNKVVRADYRDIFYTKMALEAQDVWRSDPLWRPFYHESGIYWISETGFGRQVLDNFERLGVKAELYSYPVEEARKQNDGVFDDADYTNIKEVLVNKSSGWADAKEALQKIIETSVELGVTYVEAEIVALELADGGIGDCTGVKTRGGQTISADRIVLSTGAYTARLLEDSAPKRPNLHALGRWIAAGVTEGIAPLNNEQLDTFANMPVAIQEVPPERGWIIVLKTRDVQIF